MQFSVFFRFSRFSGRMKVRKNLKQIYVLLNVMYKYTFVENIYKTCLSWMKVPQPTLDNFAYFQAVSTIRQGPFFLLLLLLLLLLLWQNNRYRSRPACTHLVKWTWLSVTYCYHSRIVNPTYGGTVYSGLESMTGMLLRRTSWRLNIKKKIKKLAISANVGFTQK